MIMESENEYINEKRQSMPVSSILVALAVWLMIVLVIQFGLS